MDPAIRLLRELQAQQARDPDHNPSGQSAADVLRLPAEDCQRLLEELLEDGFVEVIPTTPRAGDGPLDELVRVTKHGLLALDRVADEDAAADDPGMKFLRSVHDHLEARSQNRISAGVIAQALRLDQNTAAATVEQLAGLGLLRAHGASKRLGSRLNLLVELTPEGRSAVSAARSEDVGSQPGSPLVETYSTRDLPVLREAARVLDSEAGMYGLRFSQLVEATGLPATQVELALRALAEDGLLEVRWAHPREASRIAGLTSAARERVGLWPTPASALERMIAALEAIAQNTDDEDTRTRARKILDGLAGAGRQIGISVAAAALTGQIPGA